MKPTTFLTVSLQYFDDALEEYWRPPSVPIETLIGRDSANPSAGFRTAVAKEYPQPLCQVFAAAFAREIAAKTPLQDRALSSDQSAWMEQVQQYAEQWDPYCTDDLEQVMGTDFSSRTGAALDTVGFHAP